MERLSKLVCENLMSGLWEGLWERIIMEDWNDACPVKCDVGAISTGEEKELSNCVAVRRCCSVPKDAVLTGF
jgi:hypothetical protein